MHVVVARAALSAAVLVVVWVTLGTAQAAVVDLGGERIQRALAANLSGSQAVAIGGVLLKAPELRAIYGGRDFQPIWIGPEGAGSKAAALRRALARSDLEGLDPLDYHATQIDARWDAAAPGERAELELLLSDGLMRYGADVGRGRLDPKLLDPELFVFPRVVDQVALLRQAAESHDLERFLAGLPPQHTQYGLFRLGLAYFRKVAVLGGWPRLPDGPTLKPGKRHPSISLLRDRLRLSRDLEHASGAETELFDEDMEAAVRRFQLRYGLEPDGIVGRKTRAELNLPVEARIRQIVLNMERWRWMPDDLGEIYLLVNLAAFELQLVDRGERKLTARVVVGRPYRRTPMFSSRVSHIVFNPTWYVPRRIAALDLLAGVQADPGLLRAQGFRVFTGRDEHEREYDPNTIDWAAITPETLPYRFRQDPGPQNALGRVKFELPNPFQVFLHDTPARELFTRAERAHSAGCIRVERPFELVRRLLGARSAWGEDQVQGVIETGRTKRVAVPEPANIHLVYMTAWISEDATLHFRRDVYGRDERLDNALSARTQ